MTTRDLVLTVLERRHAATLRELVETTHQSVHAVCRALRPLREEGIVQPPVRYGQRGRWHGGPVVYRLVFVRLQRRQAKRLRGLAARKAKLRRGRA